MRRLVTILGLLAAGFLVMPSSALGECDGPFPSFEHAAASARRVVIGQVVGTLPGAEALEDGRTSRFVLRGWSVLESDSPVEIDVQDLQSQPCAGYIVARPGDRIAIAFEGHDFAPAQVVNAVAWLQGDPPRFDGIESTTIGAIYDLLGREPPVLAVPAASDLATSSSLGPLMAAAVAVAVVSALGVLVWRRRPR